MSDLPVDPTITIRAETLFADPDTCKFTVSRTVHPGGPFFFDDKDRAGGSPLVERLFALPGVAHVLVTESVVTRGHGYHITYDQLMHAIDDVDQAYPELNMGRVFLVLAPFTNSVTTP